MNILQILIRSTFHFNFLEIKTFSCFFELSALGSSQSHIVKIHSFDKYSNSEYPMRFIYAVPRDRPLGQVDRELTQQR